MGKNILLSRFSALGDIAMTIPAVYDACLSNPEDNFFFLTRKHPAQLFINKPENLTVVAVDLDNYPGVKGMWRLASALKMQYGINLFLDLHNVLRTKLLRTFFMLRGIKSLHLNKSRAQRKKLTRRHHKILLPLKPTTQRYRDVLSSAGLDMKAEFKSLFGDGKGNPADFKSVTAPKKEGEYWLAVAPFAQHEGKIYPFPLLTKVLEEVAQRPGIKIFIFGFGAREDKLIASIADKYPNMINMAAQNIGLGNELSLLSHCDVMLSMDSANMHLASLVGLRTVSIWGATHPYTGFFGWHQDVADAVQLDMTCRPCSIYGNKPCRRGDYHCLWGITPQMVIQRLQIPSGKP